MTNPAADNLTSGQAAVDNLTSGQDSVDIREVLRPLTLLDTRVLPDVEVDPQDADSRYARVLREILRVFDGAIHVQDQNQLVREMSVAAAEAAALFAGLEDPPETGPLASGFVVARKILGYALILSNYAHTGKWAPFGTPEHARETASTDIEDRQKALRRSFDYCFYARAAAVTGLCVVPDEFEIMGVRTKDSPVDAYGYVIAMLRRTVGQE